MIEHEGFGFWVCCQQALGHNLETFWHKKVQFDQKRFTRPVVSVPEGITWFDKILKNTQDAQMSVEAFFVGFGLFLGTFYTLTCASIVQMNWNFLKTCSQLVSLKKVSIWKKMKFDTTFWIENSRKS